MKNLLHTALSMVPKQTATLHRWKGRVQNDRLLEVDVYLDPVSITASIQPVDRSRFQYMGLDASKSFVAIYATQDVLALMQTGNPDVIDWMGRRYRVENRADWHGTADYTAALAVDIGPAPEGVGP